MRGALYRNKKAAVEEAFALQDPSGEGLLTQGGFEAALHSRGIKLGSKTTTHVWHIYGSEGMLVGGRLPIAAFMKRFILSATMAASPATSRPGNSPKIESEKDLTAAILKNHKKILMMSQKKDRTRQGCIPYRTFFRVLADLGIALNEVEQQIVARKFTSTLKAGINYADFVRSFLARTSAV